MTDSVTLPCDHADCPATLDFRWQFGGEISDTIVVTASEPTRTAVVLVRRQDLRDALARLGEG